MFNKKKIEALSQRLDDVQERLEKMDSEITSLVPVDNSISKEEEPFSPQMVENIPQTDEDKLKAAYALNLCTVSISQIVDYDDLNVLEQEYNAILNNLNLENFPHDEEFLKVLKQILDTITFFRIQEGDKKFIEKEYQKKMKNAIWKAVPNLAVILASGNPIAIATSIVSQVGIGYMNYRKEKSESALEYEKQQWQLQRAAIEQFNALRRELFDTAWRIVDKYQIPDRYRLTESQISQYNSILMDSDIYRKRERLISIEGAFEAFPPYWYYRGHAANEIAQEYFDAEKHEQTPEFLSFREESINAFERFHQYSDSRLLRTDLLYASSCLEYVDLLDPVKDSESIRRLLVNAGESSGTYCDVKQLCAIGFMKIGDWENAKKYLRVLISEQFNTRANAQILSGIYCREWLNNRDIDAKAQNEMLKHFTESDYLYDLPELNLLPDSREDSLIVNSLNDCNERFLKRQKKTLQDKQELVLNKVVEKYTIRLNRIFQTPEQKKTYSDDYFSDIFQEQRRKDMEYALINPRLRKAYNKATSVYSLKSEYVDALNSFANTLSINALWDMTVMNEKLADKFNKEIEKIDLLQIYLDEERFSIDHFYTLWTIGFQSIVAEYVTEYRNASWGFANSCKDLSQLSSAEDKLSAICEMEKIDTPDVLFTMLKHKLAGAQQKRVTLSIAKIIKSDDADETIRNSMVEICQNSIEDLNCQGQFKFYTSGIGDIRKFYLLNKEGLSKLSGDSLLDEFKDRNIVAILSSGSPKFKECLFFTHKGIYWLDGKTAKLTPYSEIKKDLDLVHTKVEIERHLKDAFNKNKVDKESLLVLIEELSQVQ